MSNPGSSGPDFFKEHGHIIFPVLGALGFIVLAGCAYAVWRGPQRSFLPLCLTRRMRRNIVDDESSDIVNEKRIPDGTSRRAEAGRRAIGTGPNGERGASSADEFKREVVASLYGGQMGWVTQAGPGTETRQAVGGGGNNLWGANAMASGVQGEQRMVNDEATAASDLPRRRSSFGATQAFPDGTTIPDTSIYPSLPPAAATADSYPYVAHGAPHQSDQYHFGPNSSIPSDEARRTSRGPEQHYHGSRRDQRTSRAHHPANKPAYVNTMKAGQDSNVW